MANPTGSWIWYELMTADVERARTFYNDVVGWRIDPEASGDMNYLMIADDDGLAGGVLPMSAEMIAQGSQPQWIGYIGVDDVDAAAAAVIADGGTQFMPPTTMDGIGRFAMLADPQGVPFYLMTPTPPPGQPDATSTVFSGDPAVLRRVGWNELASPDLAASKAFYAAHFGYEFNDVMSMGPMGDYCFVDHGGQRLGAIMPRQHPDQPTRWLFYFRVPSVTAAKAAVSAGGGTVVMGPMEVPGGVHVIIATDPEGVGFGIVGELGA